MELAHAVVVVGGAHREDGHREARVSVLRIDAAEGEELVFGEAEGGAVRAEVVLDEGGLERVVAGGDGRVRREDAAGAVGFARDREADAALAHGAADALDGQKRRVAFVHVAHGRREAHGFERVDAADAEHDFLPDAELLIAPVERAGDGAVGGRVVFDVRVEEKERNAPHLHAP